MGILVGEELNERLEGDNPLVSPVKAEQIQPNGIELTLADISYIKGPGRLAFDNPERRLPEYIELPFDGDGWVFLQAGIYLVTYHEIVNIHNDLLAFARPRSSLLRMGATIYSALWDTGYVGRSRTPLHVLNPEGIYLRRGARLIQLIFVRLNEDLSRVYEGEYLGENM
jgi:dUTP pyrophosphatase